jgi:hypothetical protein
VYPRSKGYIDSELVENNPHLPILKKNSDSSFEVLKTAIPVKGIRAKRKGPS